MYSFVTSDPFDIFFIGSVLDGFYYRNLRIRYSFIPIAFPVRFFQSVFSLTALYKQVFWSHDTLF